MVKPASKLLKKRNYSVALRAADLVPWRRSNLCIIEGDCFGQEQERPRNDNGKTIY